MYLLIVLFAWILGIATMGYVLPNHVCNVAPYLWAITSLFALSLFFKFKFSKSLYFKIIFACALGLSTFFIAQRYADHQLDLRMQNRFTQAEQSTLIVYVQQIDEHSIQQDRMRHKQQILWVSHSLQKNLSLLLYLDDQQPSLVLGQYYRVTGKIKPAHSYAVPHVFDQEKWFIQQGIMGALQVNSIQLITEQEVPQLGYTDFTSEHQGLLSNLKIKAESTRLYFREFIQKHALDHKGLLLALLTADESFLNESTKNQFKKLGISHLLAISGPHVLILAFMVSFCVNFIVSHFWSRIYLIIPRPYFLILPFVVSVFAYTAFVGFEIPALRTCLTVCLMSLMLVLNQKIGVLKILLLSASILLYLDPFSILSSAFWLSYVACFVLIRVYQTMLQYQHDEIEKQQTKPWISIFIRHLRLFIESQWKIFLALFPLILLIFQQVSWLSPLVNLIAIPLIGVVVVPLEVLGACMSLLFPILGLVFFKLADMGLSFLLSCLNIFDAFFYADLSWIALQPTMIVLLALIIFILFLPRGTVPKAWAVVGVLVLILGQKSESDFELTVLDVGQGQGIFLKLPDKAMMIDTGGYYNEEIFSLAKNIVIPYLMGQGIAQLDQVILSHLDQDHAGAYAILRQSIDVKSVYSNERDQRFDQDQFHYCHAGQQWLEHNIKIKILAPQESQLSQVKDNQNERSCIVYIQVPQSKGFQNFLIMGDAGWETEYQLMQQYPDLKVDVLVLGHHGSEHSSSYDFLKHYQPKLAVASAGFNNRYGHPHPIVLARLAELSIPFKTTIDEGSVQFKLNQKNEMEISSYRHQRKWLMR